MVDLVCTFNIWSHTLFTLSNKSLTKLEGVDQKLVEVVKLAITLTTVDFVVTEGLRSKDRQIQLVAEGKSRTLNSKHIVGKAVDLAALVDGHVSWNLKEYFKIAEAMKEAANKLGVKITWGAVWDKYLNDINEPLNAEVSNYSLRFTKATGRKPLVDAPHFELK